MDETEKRKRGRPPKVDVPERFRFQARLRQELRERIESAADRDRRSLNEEIEGLLELGLDVRDQAPRNWPPFRDVWRRSWPEREPLRPEKLVRMLSTLKQTVEAIEQEVSVGGVEAKSTPPGSTLPSTAVSDLSVSPAGAEPPVDSRAEHRGTAAVSLSKAEAFNEADVLAGLPNWLRGVERALQNYRALLGRAESASDVCHRLNLVEVEVNKLRQLLEPEQWPSPLPIAY